MLLTKHKELLPMAVKLDRSTLRLLILGAVLPNTPFLIAIVLGIGTPVRSKGILLHLLAAMIGRHFGKIAYVFAISCAFILDLILTVASFFGFSLRDLPQTLRFAGEVSFFSAPFYVAMAIVLGLAYTLTIVLGIRWHESLKRGRLVLLLSLTAAVFLFDFSVNRDPHYGIGRVIARDKEVRSALVESGLAEDIMQGTPRHRVIIIVEGFGVHVGTSQSRAVIEPLLTAATMFGWSVEEGTIPYYGSTKEAELRELCSTRVFYADFLTKPDSSCIPFQAAKRGYRTVGLHPYSGVMFQREQWWGNIGLETQIFGENLSDLPQCGKAFAGACDTAVVQKMATIMRNSREPLLFYYLTLNTHIPITPDQHSAPKSCDGQKWLGINSLCHLDIMWTDLFRHIGMLIANSDMPPFDVLIVGDHAPPLWSRRERLRFEPGVVPWIRLQRNEESKQSEHLILRN
jgi:hypothetical protein